MIYGFSTDISRNDPISSVIHKLPDNSPTDWPFHVIFSGNHLLAEGFQFIMRVLARGVLRKDNF